MLLLLLHQHHLPHLVLLLLLLHHEHLLTLRDPAGGSWTCWVGGPTQVHAATTHPAAASHVTATSPACVGVRGVVCLLLLLLLLLHPAGQQLLLLLQGHHACRCARQWGRGEGQRRFQLPSSTEASIHTTFS